MNFVLPLFRAFFYLCFFAFDFLHIHGCYCPAVADTVLGGGFALTLLPLPSPRLFHSSYPH